MPEHFHFLQPAWLWALLPLTLLLWQLVRPAGADTAWRRVVDARLLPHLLVQTGQHTRRLPVLLLATGWLLTVLALADPVWEKQPQPVYRSQAARVVVLDLSRSMLTPDLKPSRLVRARYKVADILRRSDEGQTGLVVFAGDAFAVSPLTSDSDTILALLEPLEPALMPVQGSRADLGLLKAGELLRQAGVQRGDILLIADGYSDRRSIDAARKLKQQGYRVSVLAVGTREGAPLPDGRRGFVRDANGKVVTPKLDRSAMQELAAAGGGRFAVMRGDQSDIDTLLSGSNVQPGSDVTRSDQQTDVWKSRGPWLVLLMLPLAALVFRRGWLLMLTVIVLGGALTAPQPAMASVWDDLWQRRDQQAYRALQAGQPEQAAKLAEDPLRRGTAEYRAGKFDQAVQDFSAGDGADAAYNRGNALARLGRYEEAIKAYEQALQAAPGMEDAVHNKAEVEKLLQQQQQQQQQNQQKKQDQDQKQGQGAGDQSDQNASGSPQPGDQGEDSQEPSGQQAPQEGESQQADAGQAGDQQDREDGTRDGEQRSEDAQAEQAEQQAAEGDDSEPSAEAAQKAGAPPPVEANPLNSEEQQAAEQWLRRIPDDPGGLLRRKFLYQYRQRADRTDQEDAEAW
ncbi:MAG TPA: VWA domain-containing protein [Gammaproteobacteria bacterium]|nr:VWA domain-containing protein [Gammaproteobacteria bacterium]